MRDRILRALPQWSAILSLGACYTLFDAPFWDALIQSSLGINVNGPYLQMLVTSAEIGNLFIFVPALLADRYPPALVTIGGAALVIIGYSVLGFGMVTIADSSIIEVVATVFTYSWGAGWIYAAAFVTIASNIAAEARGHALGTGLAAFYFASSWWTEVTEYCCIGETTFEKSAWRHMPIAGTAILCSAGLYIIGRNGSSTTKCSLKDAGLDKIWIGYMVLLGLHTYQWIVTGGEGSRDLSKFAWGDIPFSFGVLYFCGVSFFGTIYARNLMKYGIEFCAALHRNNRSGELKEMIVDKGISGSRHGMHSKEKMCKDMDIPWLSYGNASYKALCAIVAVNIGVVQTVAYNWETIKLHYGGHGTDVAQIYNISRVLGCLVMGKILDNGVDRSKTLCMLTGILTVTQLVLAADWNTTWATTSNGSFFLPYPFEEIPLGVCAFTAGGLYTLIPVMELEWYGTSGIGRIHGTTLLCAIGGQTFFYSILGNIVSFDILLGTMTVACAGSSCLAYWIMAKQGTTCTNTETDGTTDEDDVIYDESVSLIVT